MNDVTSDQQKYLDQWIREHSVLSALLHPCRFKQKYRDQWIREHGSPHLRRLLQEGIACDRTYQEERLAKELPDWEYHPEDLCLADAADPPPAAIELLDHARQTLPNAALDKYVLYQGSVAVERGFVPVGEFLGRFIVYKRRYAMPE